MLKDDHLIVCAIVSFVLLRDLLNNDVLSSSEKQTFHGYYFRHMLSSLVKGKKIHTGIILGLAQYSSTNMSIWFYKARAESS